MKSGFVAVRNTLEMFGSALQAHSNQESQLFLWVGFIIVSQSAHLTAEFFGAIGLFF
jgi:hypothetical protein